MDDYQEALARIETEAAEKTGELDLGGLPTLSEMPKEIAGLSHLQSLNLSFSAVSDLSYISSLDNLESLSCVSTELRDLKPLANLRRLREFTCLGTKVRDLGPLSGLNNLEHLVCGETNVNDLTPLENLTNLLLLDCWNTEVYDLTPIRKLINLKHLNVSSTIVQDLSPVRDFDKLVYLNCSFTNVRELSSTLLLKNLKRLDCFECKIVSPPQAILKSLRNLHTFILGGAPIPDIPPNILSKSWDDNCLDRLRAHFDDLEQGGEVDDAHIKLLILGNGSVGKTQITGRLCDPNFTFDEKSVSTHGIVIREATLPAIDDVPVTLSVWDFGGQDIYHGTHALFLNSPAILALIWDSKTEGERQEERMDKWERNYPLLYWVALAQQHGYGNSAIIPVQSKCDTVRSEAAPTIHDPESVSNLRFPWRPLSLSAKTGYGWSSFTERLQAAVAWMRDPDHVGMPKIGAGRKRVREKLIALRETQNLLSMSEFEALCKEDGDISSPDAMLSWLHADGTVYYRGDLFNDQIVLDQQWALDAIYALFDRERGALKTLRETRGRFTREVLARLVWQNYSQDEQDLFLSMMVSCGICFKHRMVREVGREVQEYITPDLLPDRAVVTDDIARHWKDGDSGEQARVSFPILHGGLIRTILSDIGGGKGSEHALYWNRGILARDGHSQSHFIIEQLEDYGEVVEQSGWRGSIYIRTQGDKAADLLSRLLKLVHSTIDRIGLKGAELDSSIPWSPHGDQHGRNSALLSLVAMRPWNRNWFVSYAWDEQVFFVDCLCDAAKAHEITILRDKNEIKLGDSIHGFMNKLRDGERVFVVLSDKYLRSANCMYELAEIWDRSQKDPEQFLPRICLWTMPDAKIWTPTDRATYAVHWREQFNKLNAIVKEHGEEILGPSDRTALRNMRRFSTDVGEILATFADRIQPRTWADIVRKGFAD